MKLKELLTEAVEEKIINDEQLKQLYIKYKFVPCRHTEDDDSAAEIAVLTDVPANTTEQKMKQLLDVVFPDTMSTIYDEAERWLIHSITSLNDVLTKFYPGTRTEEQYSHTGMHKIYFMSFKEWIKDVKYSQIAYDEDDFEDDDET